MKYNWIHELKNKSWEYLLFCHMLVVRYFAPSVSISLGLLGIILKLKVK